MMLAGRTARPLPRLCRGTQNKQLTSNLAANIYTQGDCDVISMPAGFRRHLFERFFTLISLKYALLASQ